MAAPAKKLTARWPNILEAARRSDLPGAATEPAREVGPYRARPHRERRVGYRPPWAVVVGRTATTAANSAAILRDGSAAVGDLSEVHGRP